MKLALIAFDGMTALDFVGFYDPVTRLKSMGFLSEIEWQVHGMEPRVHDDRGLAILSDRVWADLGYADLIFVPGGHGWEELSRNGAFMEWLQTAQDIPTKVSVCSGSLLLGAAGFLRGKRATTHPSGYERLAPFCREVVRERIVDEGDVITAGGVSASIDLGLHLVERLAGAETRKAIARQMDYPYGMS